MSAEGGIIVNKLHNLSKRIANFNGNMWHDVEHIYCKTFKMHFNVIDSDLIVKSIQAMCIIYVATNHKLSFKR